MSRKISQKLREKVQLCADGLCEYCFAPEKILINMQVDHVIPFSQGGLTTLDNLCYSCSSCNRGKYMHQFAKDPISSMTVRLFNPRSDNWQDHFDWSSDLTIFLSLTAIGRATSELLKFNAPRVCGARLIWLMGGWNSLQLE